MNHLQSTMQRYQLEADSITSQPMTVTSRARLQFLLSAISTMKREFGTGGTGNDDEQRKASLRFREALLGESRTYSPMSLTGQPQIVPQDFSDQMAVLGLASGPLYLGNRQLLTCIDRQHNEPLKVPVSTDLSVGFTQAEAGLITEQELNFNKVSLGTNTFSTGIMLVGNDLSDDISSWTTVQNLLLRTASGRLSRRQNQQFIPALVTTLAANSTASVASAVAGVIGADDISSLVASVNAQYRSSDFAGFLLNSDTARQIYGIKGTDGLRIFKHVLDPKPTLLNYPCFVSDYADNIATGNHPLIFGDWSYVYSRQIPGFEIQVLHERFVIDYQAQGVIIRQRGDLQYSVPSTSQSALKMLTIS